MGDVISTAADVVVAVFAGVALWVGLRQVRISHEIGALQAYENYHMACLQYPAFASGRLDFEKCAQEKRDCYVTFVLYALMTGERVLRLFPRDPSWVHAVKDDIRLHRRLIVSSAFRHYRRQQDTAIRRLVIEVLCEKAGSKGRLVKARGRKPGERAGHLGR